MRRGTGVMTMPLSWDIFCRVVDNYGDAAVCWRLARELAEEHRAPVRLWIDKPAVLHVLCPDVDPAPARQRAAGVDVVRWDGGWQAPVELHDVVVEAFGCGLPEPLVAAMLQRARAPLWITLEYLSAEAWVAEHHGLQSPHPRHGLDRYFFFPGFTPNTGGVLREADLDTRRAAFEQFGRAEFWRTVGFEPPLAGSVAVSLFAYPGAPLEALLAGWERGEEAVVAVVPEGHLAERVRAHFSAAGAAPGSSLRRGRVEVRLIPFLPQPRYDELLWSCDVNFVRGEDSFVRAQWAERPFLWHAYPQEAEAHRLKLDAFLDAYAEGLEGGAAAALRTLAYQWNLVGGAPVNLAGAWQGFRRWASAFEAHAPRWAARAARSGDMAANLAQFARERVK